MFWLLFGGLVVLLLILVVVLFIKCACLDEDDHNIIDRVKALSKRFEALDHRVNSTYQPAPADPLDKEITLTLTPASDGSEDSYFRILDASHENAKECGVAYGGDTPQSTQRTVTLRELLNRLLKDFPVELVHPVKADWNFACDLEPPAETFSGSKTGTVNWPPYTIGDRKHPLDPPVSASFNAHQTGTVNTSGASLAELLGFIPPPHIVGSHDFPLFTDHN